jgi:hypothetical protein
MGRTRFLGIQKISIPSKRNCFELDERDRDDDGDERHHSGAAARRFADEPGKEWPAAIEKYDSGEPEEHIAVAGEGYDPTQAKRSWIKGESARTGIVSTTETQNRRRKSATIAVWSCPAWPCPKRSCRIAYAREPRLSDPLFASGSAHLAGRRLMSMDVVRGLRRLWHGLSFLLRRDIWIAKIPLACQMMPEVNEHSLEANCCDCFNLA